MTTNSTPEGLGPDTLYHGLAGRYVALMQPSTEAPPEFHLGAFLTVAGLVFADVSLPEGGHRHYPTTFALLVGPTGQARKTTVANAAFALLADVAPEVPVIHPEGSRQGLMEALIRASASGIETLLAASKGEIPVTTSGTLAAVGVPTGLRGAEFTTTLRQAGRSVTSDMTEMLLQLFDRPARLESNTRDKPLVLIRPCVALLGDATEEALAELFGESNVTNGLLNRLSLWTGTAIGEPKPRPPAPDAVERAAIVAELRRLRADTPLDLNLGWSDAGGAAFDALYVKTLHPRRQSASGAVLAREESHVKRYAMLAALLRGSDLIDPEDVAYGWAIVEYLSHGALSLAGKLSTGGRGKALATIEEAIARKASEGTPIRAGAGYLARHVSPSRRGPIDEQGGTAQLVSRLLADGRVEVHPSDHEGHGERPYYFTPDTAPGTISAKVAGAILAGSTP